LSSKAEPEDRIEGESRRSDRKTAGGSVEAKAEDQDPMEAGTLAQLWWILSDYYIMAKKGSKMNAQKNGRRRRGGDRAGYSVVGSSPIQTSHLVSGPADPPSIKAEVAVRKVVRMELSFGSATPSVFSPNAIGAYLPGGVLNWRSFRINKISAWGSDSGSFTPTVGGGYSVGLQLYGIVGGGAVQLSDAGVYVDDGTLGRERAHLHVVPNMLMRQYWWLVTDNTSQLFTVTVSPSVPAADTITVTVDLDLELMSLV